MPDVCHALIPHHTCSARRDKKRGIVKRRQANSNNRDGRWGEKHAAPGVQTGQVNRDECGRLVHTTREGRRHGVLGTENQGFSKRLHFGRVHKNTSGSNGGTDTVTNSLLRALLLWSNAVDGAGNRNADNNVVRSDLQYRYILAPAKHTMVTRPQSAPACGR